MASAVRICPPTAMVAVLCGGIAAFGGFKSHPSPEKQRMAHDALKRIGSVQPVTQTPAVQRPVAALIGRDPVVRHACRAARARASYRAFANCVNVPPDGVQWDKEARKRTASRTPHARPKTGRNRGSGISAQSTIRPRDTNCACVSLIAKVKRS